MHSINASSVKYLRVRVSGKDVEKGCLYVVFVEISVELADQFVRTDFCNICSVCARRYVNVAAVLLMN